jgi:hypothetical protein
MKLSISEILKRASDIKDETARIGWLRQNSSTTLHAVLRGIYDPNIKWSLPEGTPPYKENDLVDQESILYSESRKFYLFTEGGNPNLKQVRREYLFIQLLESIDKEDAKLMIAVKDKKMPYKNITLNVVNTAFPGLIAA